MQAVDHDGLKRMIEPFDPERMIKLLEDRKVKEVRVFRLKKGMTINIKNTHYKVIAVRPNGKVTLKEKK